MADIRLRPQQLSELCGNGFSNSLGTDDIYCAGCISILPSHSSFDQYTLLQTGAKQQTID